MVGLSLFSGTLCIIENNSSTYIDTACSVQLASVIFFDVSGNNDVILRPQVVDTPCILKSFHISETSMET